MSTMSSGHCPLNETTKMSSAIPRLDLMPDLVLIEVFDKLSLVDLFRSVPLVCHNWTRLQPSALARRTKLYLLPDTEPNHWIRMLEPGIIAMPIGNDNGESPVPVIDPKDGDWSDFHLVQAEHQGDPPPQPPDLTLDMIPLSTGVTASVNLSNNPIHHLKPLASKDAVNRFCRALPSLTELTVVVRNDQVPNYQEQWWRRIGSHAMLIRNLTQLVEHHSSRLTTLRLHLHRPYGEEIDTDGVDKAIRELVELINSHHRLPLLRTLQLNLNWVSSFRWRAVPLSEGLLSRLRLLVLNSAGNSDMRSGDVSLLTRPQPRPQEGIAAQHRQHRQHRRLHPRLAIIYGRHNPVETLVLLREQPQLARHLRSLTVYKLTFPNRIGRLSDLCSGLPNLTSLQLRLSLASVCSMSRLLTVLAPLQHRLVCLYVEGMPSLIRRDDANARQPQPPLPSFTALRRLTAGYLGPSFPVGQYFPNIHRLGVISLQCQWRRVSPEQRLEAILTLARHCFRTCSELSVVTYGNQHFTRGDFIR